MKFPTGFKPKKSLGQSFLVSNKIADTLISALELTDKDIVLEIGAGLGILTARLCEKAGKVYAVEIDSRFIPTLKENTRQFHNIAIINQDILEFNWHGYNSIKIIGNIPYNISSEIMLKLLENINKWNCAVITAQREFTDKLLSSVGKKSYCATTVLFQFYTKTEKILTVPASAFRPSPKIVSTAVLIKKPASPLFPDIDFSTFARAVNASFKQPRKTIANNLSHFLGIDKNQLEQVTQLDMTRRAQYFSINEYYQLTKYLSKLFK